MLVYQHIATFERLYQAQEWIHTMYPGQKMPDSWLGLYKEKGSGVFAYDFKDETASEFGYQTDDPFFNLRGKFRARSPTGIQLDILEYREIKTGKRFDSVVKYRGFATQIGANHYKVF